MVYFLNATVKNILTDTSTRVQSRGFNLVPLSQLQEIPSENMILLAGPPGSGKSTFCQQSILQNLTVDKPVIYVTTKYASSRIESALKARGLGNIDPG